jgi:hypothetical protein
VTVVRESLDARIARLRREREELDREIAAAEMERERRVVEKRRLYDRFEDIRKHRGRIYSTWFRAYGTTGRHGDFDETDTGTAAYQRLEALIYSFTEDESGLEFPAAFRSQQGSILGQVKWRGLRRLETIIAELNAVLGIDPEDFREVYPVWSYRYFVLEQLVPGDEGEIIFDTGNVRGQ